MFLLVVLSSIAVVGVYAGVGVCTFDVWCGFRSGAAAEASFGDDVTECRVVRGGS